MTNDWSGAKRRSFFPRSLWFWTVVILTVGTNFLVFMIPEGSIFTPLRWAIGLFFMLFLPGYCLIKSLLPRRELDSIQVICLSVGLSLGILSIDGLMVNFIAGNLALPYIMLSLSFLVLVLALTASLKRKS